MNNTIAQSTPTSFPIKKPKLVDEGNHFVPSPLAAVIGTLLKVISQQMQVAITYLSQLIKQTKIQSEIGKGVKQATISGGGSMCKQSLIEGCSLILSGACFMVGLGVAAWQGRGPVKKLEQELIGAKNHQDAFPSLQELEAETPLEAAAAPSLEQGPGLSSPSEAAVASREPVPGSSSPDPVISMRRDEGSSPPAAAAAASAPPQEPVSFLSLRGDGAPPEAAAASAPLAAGEPDTPPTEPLSLAAGEPDTPPPAPPAEPAAPSIEDLEKTSFVDNPGFTGEELERIDRLGVRQKRQLRKHYDKQVIKAQKRLERAHSDVMNRRTQLSQLGSMVGSTAQGAGQVTAGFYRKDQQWYQGQENIGKNGESLNNTTVNNFVNEIGKSTNTIEQVNHIIGGISQANGTN